MRKRTPCSLDVTWDEELRAWRRILDSFSKTVENTPVELPDAGINAMLKRYKAPGPSYAWIRRSGKVIADSSFGVRNAPRP